MLLTCEGCSFRTVLDRERMVLEGDADLLFGLGREILACQRRRVCRDADCCTILGAALIVRYGPQSDP